MILRNDIGLIGDFLGTIPVMIDLAEKHGHLDVMIHPEIGWIFPYINSDKITRVPDGKFDMKLDILEAFRYSDLKGLYMTQCHHYTVGLPTPIRPLRAALKLPVYDYTDRLDYVVAPFSRSLPENQLISWGTWLEVFHDNPEFTFGILGTTKHDDLGLKFFKSAMKQRKNVSILRDLSFEKMMNSLLTARRGLLSIVTGPSHLAFHMGVKNILIVNQGMWGKNPEALIIDKPIPEITAKDISQDL